MSEGFSDGMGIAWVVSESHCMSVLIRLHPSGIELLAYRPEYSLTYILIRCFTVLRLVLVWLEVSSLRLLRSQVRVVGHSSKLQSECLIDVLEGQRLKRLTSRWKHPEDSMLLRVSQYSVYVAHSCDLLEGSLSGH